MQQVQAAALAPADPSGQDRSVAAQAAQTAAQARLEIAQQTLPQPGTSAAGDKARPGPGRFDQTAV